MGISEQMLGYWLFLRETCVTPIMFAIYHSLAAKKETQSTPYLFDIKFQYQTDII